MAAIIETAYDLGAAENRYCERCVETSVFICGRECLGFRGKCTACKAREQEVRLAAYSKEQEAKRRREMEQETAKALALVRAEKARLGPALVFGNAPAYDSTTV